MRPHRDHSIRDGFTLVEMIVVLAILMLFIALLMPALQHARQHARRTVCASNLAQLGAAAHLYAIDHRNWLPMAAESSSIRWWTRLSPYVSGKPQVKGNVWSCPSTVHNSWLGYGWNYHGLGHSPTDPRLGPTRLGRGKGDCVMLADIGYAWNPNTWGLFAIDMIPPVTGGAPPSRCHLDGLNSLTVDNHLTWHKSDTWYATTRWY